MIKVGRYSEDDLNKNKDKEDIAQKQKQTGLKYIFYKTEKRKGRKYLNVYLGTLDEYLKEGREL